MRQQDHKHDHTSREVPPFPAEVTFKAIYKNQSFLEESIRSILSENTPDAGLNSRLSRNGKFISFTVTAFFSSQAHLNNVCDALASLPGFSAMF